MLQFTCKLDLGAHEQVNEKWQHLNEILTMSKILY